MIVSCEVLVFLSREDGVFGLQQTENYLFEKQRI